ncbi:MAG: cyclic pyranopterin monophosphate synthase accessory protein [Acidimicrobiales bacterium]|nr:MAG: cyclic pyranopterin monophosphate synthase accessory protein [Acidimicrobiales bacterium]
MTDRSLTHLDPLGRARMVDVTPKEPTHRRALARGRVYMQPETASLVARGAISKGDVLAVARIAGIQAAKRTPELIPLCHPLLVGSVLINFRIEEDHIEVEAEVETVDRTGVEMEALTACAVACLTIYDMCKSVDRTMTIEDIALWEKSGGRSGTFRRVEVIGDAPSRQDGDLRQGEAATREETLIATDVAHLGAPDSETEPR